MGEAQENNPEYTCGYVDSNEVGEKGCRHLSKAVWGELEVIYLCNCSVTQLGNNIGDRGCRHIGGGGWLRGEEVNMRNI